MKQGSRTAREKAVVKTLKKCVRALQIVGDDASEWAGMELPGGDRDFWKHTSRKVMKAAEIVKRLSDSIESR